MPAKMKDEEERQLQNAALVAFSAAEDTLKSAAVITDADKMKRAGLLTQLGLGYAILDLSDQLAGEEYEEEE